MRKSAITLALTLGTAILAGGFGVPCFSADEFQCLDKSKHTAITHGDTQVTDSDVTLRDGNLLMVAKQSAAIKVGNLSILVDKGSMVLVKALKDAVVVRVLLDNHAGAVKIVSTGKTIRLSVGQELILSTSAEGKRIASLDGIGRRAVREYNDAALGHVAIADINLQDNLINEPALVFFRRSQEVPQHDKIVSQLIKTTAIYNMLVGSAAPYHRSSLSQ